MKKQCKQCRTVFEGRLNKEFCSIICKSTYNNELARKRNKNLKQSFDQVKANKQILKKFYPLFGNSAISFELLQRAGFQPAFTSVQSNNDLYIYDDWGLKAVAKNQFQIIKLQNQ